jgi:hypothetical protein
MEAGNRAPVSFRIFDFEFLNICSAIDFERFEVRSIQALAVECPS